MEPTEEHEGIVASETDDISELDHAMPMTTDANGDQGREVVAEDDAEDTGAVDKSGQSWGGIKQQRLASSGAGTQVFFAAVRFNKHQTSRCLSV